jgi:hypothetical protein
LSCVPGSDEWWNQALRAFKAFIELSAVAGDPPVKAGDDAEKELK